MIIPNINNAQFEALVRQFYKEKARENSTLQRRSMMTSDERGRKAVIDMALQRKHWFEKLGVEKSFEDCQRHLEEIANRAEKK